MTSARKNHQSNQQQQRHKVPAPADYYDEVSDEQLAKIKALVEDEFDTTKPEVIAGPAW